MGRVFCGRGGNEVILICITLLNVEGSRLKLPGWSLEGWGTKKVNAVIATIGIDQRHAEACILKHEWERVAVFDLCKMWTINNSSRICAFIGYFFKKSCINNIALAGQAKNLS